MQEVFSKLAKSFRSSAIAAGDAEADERPEWFYLGRRPDVCIEGKLIYADE